MKSHLVIVGLGDVVSYKYLECIKGAVQRGELDGYSVIDVEAKKSEVIQRISAIDLKPENTFFIERPSFSDESSTKTFEPIFAALLRDKPRLKVFISTEARAHLPYLRYCLANRIDSLVEKPVITPVRDDGHFDAAAILPRMRELVGLARRYPANHSVMTLGRYHRVYNDEMVDVVRKKVLSLGAPITSFHLRTASGVWNLHNEYEAREDHPYKYGYGMLMHGAYHYVDLLAQFMSLNRLVYPKDKLTFEIVSFAAFPEDQSSRIPPHISARFDDVAPIWTNKSPGSNGYGETDIVSTFRMFFNHGGKTLTVGTFSLEQTTPSVRAWKEFPSGLYNKNGRVSCTDIEVQLSTLFSLHGRSFKVPKAAGGRILQIDNHAQVQTRENASLLGGDDYNTDRTFSNFFNSNSNRKLMEAWFSDAEQRSRLVEHYQTMAYTQAIALSVQSPGEPITIDPFEFAEHEI